MTTQTAQHTLTPWRPGDGNSILATWPDGTEVQIAAMFHTTWSGNDGGKTRRIQDETPRNRALIIRAVNNYDALLEACEAVQLATIADTVPAWDEAIALVRAAIAAAKEGASGMAPA